MTGQNINEPSQSEINTAITLFSSGQLQEALDKISALTKNFPKDSLLHNIMGACYAGLGQLASAIDCYDRAILINPNYSKAHYNLGSAYHELRQYNDSVKSYKISLIIDPDYAEAHNNLGNVLRESGELDEAVISYEKALTLKPDYVEAHYGLGIVFEELGQLEAMIEHLKEAVAIKPDFAEAHNRIGTALEQLDQIEDAVKFYNQAIKINPNSSETYNNLANVLKELGKLDEAINAYQKALEINPDYPALHNNLGNVYKELGQFDKAAKSYLKGLTFNPDFVDLLNNLGIVMNDLDRPEEAIKIFKRAIAIKTDYAEAFNNLGVAFNKLNQHEEVIQAYEDALKINPNFPDPYNNLTVVYRKQGLINNVISSFKMAINSMEKVVAIDPADTDTHNNLGIAYTEINSLDNAVKSFKKAVSINPKFADAYNSLGIVLDRLNQYEDAIKAFEKAFNINPNIDYILGNILNAKMHSCNWNNLSNLFANLKKKVNNNTKIVDPFNLMSWLDDPALQRKATEIRINSEYPKIIEMFDINPYPKHSKIRIGYFSPDFRMHPVGFLTAKLYELHDRQHFEVHAFSFGIDIKDEINNRIKNGVDYFHYVDSLSHEEIVKLTRSLEIDIAIDLTGLTADSRTDIFSMSVAPIQLSYIGYLGTMGADYYDYLIADPVMIPQENQKHYVEKIIYLPSFQVNDSSELPPEITLSRKDLGLPEKGFVFCCFNNTSKLTPTTFDSWARILNAVEKSVLIIYVNNESAKINLTKEITHRGVDSKRLIFAESISRSKYLARYRVADLFLDTHPYNAGTTASDALRMGLPMIALKGQSYQSRMGASIVNALNLPELITNTPEEYESLAIELASNPDKLKAIKDKLNINLSTAPLYDTKLFTKNLESAFTQIYERHHKGLQPDHIYVEK